MPPSIHPDTQEPYRYVNGRSLQDISPSELPPLPRDYRERILALGYTLGKATKTEEPSREPEPAVPKPSSRRLTLPL